MSRSGYDYDCNNLALYRGTVYRCITGKRGRAFLMELANAMDAMPEKILIANELTDNNGAYCALGTVAARRQIDISGIDYEDARAVGNAFGIAWQLAAEIEFTNDEAGSRFETPAQRWERVRAWVQKQIDNPKYE